MSEIDVPNDIDGDLENTVSHYYFLHCDGYAVIDGYFVEIDYSSKKNAQRE